MKYELFYWKIRLIYWMTLVFIQLLYQVQEVMQGQLF